MTQPTAYDAEHPNGRPATDDDLRAVLDPEMYQAHLDTRDDDPVWDGRGINETGQPADPDSQRDSDWA